MIVDVFRISHRFRTYQPRPVTPLVAMRFIRQFPKSYRRHITTLLEHIRYVPHTEVAERVFLSLISLIDELVSLGFETSNIMIAPASMDGASSAAVLNTIESLIAARYPGIAIHRSGPTAELRENIPLRSRTATIFVDDFVGSGQQFRRSLHAWNEALIGRNQTFFLVIGIACVEGIKHISETNAKVHANQVHDENERLWAICREHLDEEFWQNIAVLACELQSKLPFGHKNSGCMVVLERNCPTNVSLLFRGTDGQRVWYGLFPRIDQLQVSEYNKVIANVSCQKKSIRPWEKAS